MSAAGSRDPVLESLTDWGESIVMSVAGASPPVQSRGASGQFLFRCNLVSRHHHLFKDKQKDMFRHGQGPDHGRIFWWQFPVVSNGYGTRSMCSTTYSKTSRRTLLRQHRGLDWFRSKMISRNDTGSATGPGAFLIFNPHIYPSSDESKLRSQKYSAL